MIGSSFIHAVNELRTMLRTVMGDYIILHCWDWDRLVRLGMVDGHIGPFDVLNPRTAFPGLPIVIEEGEQYEGCITIKTRGKVA